MDMISNLPPNIIDTVLCFLPIQEAARTSILSREWRYRWNKIPKLVFEEVRFQVSYDVAESSVVDQTVNESSDRQIRVMFRRKRFFSAISQVVLMHDGPIHELTIDMLPDDDDIKNHTCVEIDRIIFHLSRKHTVKNLTINLNNGIYELPYSLFSFSHLSDLCLVGCCFSQKPTFSGFRRLRSLSLDGVYISQKTLLHLLSSCPLFKNVTLEIDSRYIDIDESTTIINLFESLRMIESLSIQFTVLELFVYDRAPRELRALLSHLKYFYTHEIPFTQKCGLSCLVLLIRNSPNLEKLEIDNRMLDQDDSDMEDDLCTEDELYSFTVDSYPDIWLEHLKEKVKITLDYSAFDEDEELPILLILLRFPHASPVVEIII
ncbi:F-box/FBD/LRR-repeat protein-like protein [Tanacetum coccineum]|uniref:F-box/FBD/LRR-repeat protein-like protein n=1 Tax=Tanacetum coccineum TaxID=301880 RepID=A0ABQ5J8H8_9ASTR